MTVMIKRMWVFSLVFAIIIVSCDNNPTPLPRGYFRIDLPQHEYQLSDTSFPYYFEYPVYANLARPVTQPGQDYWLNIDYPQFKATVFLSYKPVDNNLITYLEDSYTLVSKHIPKAEDINDSLIEDRSRNLYGLVYKIEGSGAASPFQFFVTDSANHFVRGALYFNIAPNNDSLAPVIDFITEDLEHIINTFEWNPGYSQ